MPSILPAALLMASLGSPASGAGPTESRVGTAVGEVHPQIVLPDLERRRGWALSQFRGKKVLLVQFASW
jgi:hypothetical protein